MKYHIDCSFTVYYTLEVEAEDSFEEALESLCNQQIFTSYHGDLWGLAENDKVKVLSVDADSDPSPTGSARTVRDWDFVCPCSRCGGPLSAIEVFKEIETCEDCEGGA